jgi:hypothetical protein
MAVPQLASAGNAPSMKEMLGQQDRAGDLLTNLVDLTKTLVDGQTKIFEQLLLVLDQKKKIQPYTSEWFCWRNRVKRIKHLCRHPILQNYWAEL